MRKMLFFAFTAILSTMLFSSCKNDPTSRYESFIIGSWEAGHVNVSTNLPDDEPAMYIFTFNPNGTGLWVSKDDGSIVEDFKYTITGYPGKAGLSYDFTIKFTALKQDGTEKYNDILRGKKTGLRTWEMYSQGGVTLMHVMHKL